MPIDELAAEMRAAASSLVTAAGATENGDLVAAIIGAEDALFRVESLLARLRQAEITSGIHLEPYKDDGEKDG
jgi:hypothetical protein